MTIKDMCLAVLVSVCIALVVYYVADGIGFPAFSEGVAVAAGVLFVVYLLMPRTRIRW